MSGTAVRNRLWRWNGGQHAAPVRVRPTGGRCSWWRRRHAWSRTRAVGRVSEALAGPVHGWVRLCEFEARTCDRCDALECDWGASLVVWQPLRGRS